MTVRGRWQDGRYLPEPSVRAFEQKLGQLIAAQRCAACGEPLGSAPRRQLNRQQYHPACMEGWTPKMKKAPGVAPGPHHLLTAREEGR